MTPLYQQYMNRASQIGASSFQNPMQKMQYVMQVMANPVAFLQKYFPNVPANVLVQAMSNPAAFVQQYLSGIPANIQNDPGQILNYLQQTRGLSNQQIQQAQQMADQIIGEGNVR